MPAEWCRTKLRSGDTLSTLSKRFGVTGRQIVEGNGVRWDTEAINIWVLGDPRNPTGHALAQTGATPLPGSPTGGWVVFTDKSFIMLPCRETAPAPEAKPEKPMSTGAKLGIAGLVVFVIGGGVWYAVTRES